MLRPDLRVVTVSWDDGDARDLRIAELLHTTGLKGTFYVPCFPYHGHASLLRQDLRNLVEAGFEIGAHGVEHEHLSRLSHNQVRSIVTTCKELLQDAVGAQVSMFCYPGGHHNRDTVECVRNAGYRGARTTRMLATEMDFASYEMPTSLQAYPHNHASYLRNSVRALNVRRFYDYSVNLWKSSDWVMLGRLLFDRVLQHGGVWHLYGHSWEIDELSLWDDLKCLLEYVSGRSGVLYLHNGDLLRCLGSKRFIPSAS